MFKYKPEWQGPLSGRSFERQTEDFLNGIESRVDEIDTRQTPSDATPMPPGVGSAGTSDEYSRGDHSHPLQSSVSGNAGTASQLSEARKISMSGEGSGSAYFDGSSDISIPLEVSCIADGSTESRTIAARFSDIVNAKDFGAKGDGATDDTLALQAAINSAASSQKICFIPSGTYVISDTIRVPSNSVIAGAGRSDTKIKMSGSVTNAYVTMFLTGWRGDHRTNITIKNLTLDFNASRTTPGAFPSYATSEDNAGRGTCLSIINTEHCYVENVAALNGLMYCIDIASPSYRQYKDVTDQTPQGWSLSHPETYDTDGCEDVWLVNCYAKGGGDDNITTHFSSGIHIVNCLSEDPSGIYTGNANCIEIDDGSREVMVSHCVTRGGRSGIQIKAHQCNPAPSDVVIDDMQIYECARPIEIYHLKWYSATNLSGYTTYLPDDNSITSFGASATAKNVTLNNIQIYGPKTFSGVMYDGTPFTITPTACLDLRSYENVQLSNILIDGAGGDVSTESPITVTCYARDFLYADVAVVGYEWPASPPAGKYKYSIAMTSRSSGLLPCGPRHVMTGVAVQAPYHGILCGSGSDVSICSATITALAPPAGVTISELRYAVDPESNAVTLSALTTSGFDAPVNTSAVPAPSVTGMYDGTLACNDGMVGGALTFSASEAMKRNAANSYVRIEGGSSTSNGAYMDLFGTGHSTYPGVFRLYSRDGNGTYGLIANGSSLQWNGSEIQTASDERLKQGFSELPDAVLDAWGKVEWGQFKFRDAAQEKGAEKARWHSGLIAQRVRAVFEYAGLDACQYGILCHEQREASEDGDAVDLWMVRYAESQAMEAAWQRRRADRLEARIAALEASKR